MNARMAEEVSPTIQAHAELLRAYVFFNERLFDGELPECLITLERNRALGGMFSPDRFIRADATTVHQIALNPSTFAMATVREVLSLVAHEAVHVWAHVNNKQGRRGYHSRGWADKMEEIGLMPSSTGKPGGSRTGERVHHYIVPGGPFDRAADELLESGFDITWLDRYATPWLGGADMDAIGGHRQPLGGALIGRAGLLVAGSADDEDVEVPPVSENRAAGVEPEYMEHADHGSGTDHHANEPAEHVGEHLTRSWLGETRASDDGIGSVDHPPDEALVILGTGSKARPGEKPTSVPLIAIRGGDPTADQKPRRDKVCFQCPSCKQKAWAKGAALLDCGKCKTGMVEATPSKVEAENENA